MVVFVPHFLAASQFGVLQFATTFVSYFVLVAGLGTGTFLVKAVAREPRILGLYVFNALVMKAVLAVSFSAVAILLARSLGYPHQTFVIVEIACVGMVLFLVNDVLGAGLQGIEQMGRPAAWTVVQAFVATIVGLAVLAQGRNVVKFALVTTLAAAIPVVANAAHLRPRLRGSMRLDLRVWRTIAIGGFPFLLGASVLLIYGTIDIPLLQAMAGSVTVGWYTLAYAWVTPAAGFSSLVVKAALPSLSASARTASNEFTELTNNSIRLVMFIGLPASAGIALIAPDIFALFHYQASFWPAIPLIRILTLHIPIVGMDMVLGAALIANDKQRQWTTIGCIAAVVNVVANLFAIPFTIHVFHNGAVGAAVVTVATEALMMVGAIRLKPAGVLNRTTLSYIARFSLATLVMTGAILAMGGTSVVLKIALGVLVYAGSALVLRALSVRDLRSLALRPSLSAPNKLEGVER
jgi:O-antigen/teichoic acid export membrane protein